MRHGRAPARRRPAAVPGRATRSFAWLGAALAIVAVAVALVVHRRALAAYFGLDDLVIMEEMRGLRPLVTGPWRFLSRQLFFGAAVPRFGADPVPYHRIAWLLHGANVALLFALVRRWSGSRLAALAAAVLFGASRLHAPALETTARIGEPMALAFALGALLLSDARGVATRVLAAASFALAMLAKESVALLPLVLLVPRTRVPRIADRLRRAAPLLGACIAVGIALVLSRAEAAHLGGEAYERAFGVNVFLDLMTYTRWAFDLTQALPGQVSAIAAGAWPLGLAISAALVALVVFARGRTDLAALGVAWWLVALVPVLPLVHHTYLYYLYVPLAGLAIAAGGAIDAADALVAARGADGTRGAARLLSLVTLALLAVYTLSADALLARRQATNLPGTGIPLDPDLRKSEMARQAVGGVGSRLAGTRAGVAFFLPSELSQVYSTATGRRSAEAVPDTTGYYMLAGALDGGRGLRALLPEVDSVAFLPAWRPGYGAFEIFSQGPDGVVFALGRGADGFASAGAALRRGGAIGPAVRLLGDASREFPDASRLRYEYAHALEVAGDSLGSRRELLELIRRNPTDTLAVRVRADFERTRLR